MAVPFGRTQGFLRMLSRAPAGYPWHSNNGERQRYHRRRAARNAMSNASRRRNRA